MTASGRSVGAKVHGRLKGGRAFVVAWSFSGRTGEDVNGLQAKCWQLPCPQTFPWTVEKAASVPRAPSHTLHCNTCYTLWCTQHVFSSSRTHTHWYFAFPQAWLIFSFLAITWMFIPNLVLIQHKVTLKVLVWNICYLARNNYCKVLTESCTWLKL